MDHPSSPGYAARWAARDTFIWTCLHPGMKPAEWQALLTYRATGEWSSDPPPDEFYEERGDGDGEQGSRGHDMEARSGTHAGVRPRVDAR